MVLFKSSGLQGLRTRRRRGDSLCDQQKYHQYEFSLYLSLENLRLVVLIIPTLLDKTHDITKTQLEKQLTPYSLKSTEVKQNRSDDVPRYYLVSSLPNSKESVSQSQSV